MMGSVTPLCNGAGCGIKLKCARYKEHIDLKNEVHFAYAPNHKEDECRFFVGTNGNIFLENLKSLKDGTKINFNGES